MKVGVYARTLLMSAVSNAGGLVVIGVTAVKVYFKIQSVFQFAPGTGSGKVKPGS